MAKYHYSIARFVPNRMRGEFVNIGIVVQNLETGSIRVKFAENFARIKRICPTANVKSINPMLEVIQAKLNRNHEAGYLARLDDFIHGTIQFCEVSGGITNNIETELEKLFRLFVSDEAIVRKQPSETSQRSVTARVKRSFQESEYERLQRLTARTVLPEMGIRFPLVNTNLNGAHLLIQTVSLAHGTGKQALDAVKLFAKNADYVQKDTRYRNACLIALVQEPPYQAQNEGEMANRILSDSYPHVWRIDDENRYVDRVAEVAGVRS